MKKCYRFTVDRWVDACTADAYRRVIRQWIKDDGVSGKASLYIKDDVKIWATDSNVVHLVLINGDDWAHLPKTLDNFGSDILDLIVEAIDCRNDNSDYDAEEELYDYLCE